jgi:hypothetical protein
MQEQSMYKGGWYVVIGLKTSATRNV